MVDVTDVASDYEERMREQAIEAARSPISTVESARECECGNEIPEGRRKALPGIQSCVACAELAQRRAGQSRGRC